MSNYRWRNRFPKKKTPGEGVAWYNSNVQKHSMFKNTQRTADNIKVNISKESAANPPATLDVSFANMERSVCLGRDPQIFQKSRSYLKRLDTRRINRSKFHTEDPQILGATVQNFETRAT